MICPGCQLAADKAKELIGSADHNRVACDDRVLDQGLPYGHGCTCRHNMGVSRPSAATTR